MLALGLTSLKELYKQVEILFVGEQGRSLWVYLYSGNPEHSSVIKPSQPITVCYPTQNPASSDDFALYFELAPLRTGHRPVFHCYMTKLCHNGKIKSDPRSHRHLSDIKHGLTVWLFDSPC